MVGALPGFEGCEKDTMEKVGPGDPRRGTEVWTCHTCPTSRGIEKEEVDEQRGQHWRATRVEPGCLSTVSKSSWRPWQHWYLVRHH